MLNGILIGAAMMGAMWAAAYVERLGREAEAERRVASAVQVQRKAQRHIWCENIAELTIEPAAPPHRQSQKRKSRPECQFRSGKK